MSTMRRYSKYFYLLVISLVMAGNVSSNPVDTSSNCLDTIVRNHDQMHQVNKVLHSMGKVLEDNLFLLYNKLISLSQVSDIIVQQGQGAQIIQGTGGDMSSRCPKGFQAMAGDRMCY